MPTRALEQPESTHAGRVLRGVLAVAAGAAFLAAQSLLALAASAQAPAPLSAQTVHPAARAHKKPTAAKAAAPAAPVPPPAPAEPPPPNWPANDKPAEASVVWNSHGLLVQAKNSSLDQILKEVALKTGVKVEGMGADQRIFGVYGPGPARDVLTQLLDGSGYNILMVGEQGQGTPRRIVLSGRPAGAEPPARASSPSSGNDNNDDNDEAQEPPQPVANPMPPGENTAPAMPVRPPQQLMRDPQPLQPPPPSNPQ